MLDETQALAVVARLHKEISHRQAEERLTQPAAIGARVELKLEQFLHNPTGTMQVVLSSAIQLSPAERDSIIHILREIHEAREGHSTTP